MASLIWDTVGEREYETGVSKGVLFPIGSNGKDYAEGVAWSGLTKVTENPSGAELSDTYADNIKFLSLQSAESYAATIEALMYPDEFEECNGNKKMTNGAYIGQQNRKTFGFCYQTIVGNDTLKNEYGYKIHIVYGCTAQPSSVDHSTVNDSPEAATMSWECKANPVTVTGAKPTATFVIDSTELKTTQEKGYLASIENILYGTENTAPRLPMPDEIIAILKGETYNAPSSSEQPAG